jgi:solute carrier family 13 (sodium-dependent dicarboxylate transporter), member 2/3/5
MHIAVALIVVVIARLLPPLPGLTIAGQAVLGVAAAGFVLWISSGIPLGVAAIVVLALLGTVPSLPPSAVFAGFASPVVFFLLGSIALGAAVEQTGLARRAARRLVSGARRSPTRLYWQMLAGLPLLAFVLPSAITRNALLVPAYRDALERMGAPTATRRVLLLALGVLNPLTSSALLTGGLASMTASTLLGGVSWLRWFSLMAPPYYALLFLGGIVLRITAGRMPAGDRDERDDVGRAPLSAAEWRTLTVLGVTSVLWLTDAVHGLSPAIPALFGATVLVAPGIGVMTWRELESRLSWTLVLTLGASLSLAQALNTTGAAAWLGRHLLAVLAGAASHPLVMIGMLVIAVALIHLAVTSLSACLALVLPVVTAAGLAAGLNPFVCGLVATITIDAVIFYPVQTATNLMAYEAGYYDAPTVLRFGLAMLALTLFVTLALALPYWRLLGVPLVTP